jgi:hypothetical protein
VSAFADIQNLIVGALLATTPLAGGRVYTDKVKPVAQQATTAIVVRLESSVASAQTISVMDWSTQLAVECYARADASHTAAANVDALLAQAWERIAPLESSTLALMRLELGPDIEWSFDEADTTLACASVRITAMHRTSYQSLNPLGA